MLARPARSAVLGRLVAALLVAVASIVLLGSSPAHACRCVFGDVGRQVDRADAVFVGSFDRADRTVADGQISFDVAVDEVYRGQVSPELTVRAPYSSATCGLDGIPAGEPVAWFVHGSPGGEVRSDLCTGTTPLTPQLARRLERLAGPPGPPVTGAPSEGGIGTSGADASAGPAEPTGPAGSADSSGDRNEDASGPPWWAWTAIALSVSGALLVILRRTRRSHP